LKGIMEENEKNEKETSGFKNLAKDPVLAKAAYEFAMDTFGTLKRKRRAFESVWEECQDAFRCVEKKTYFQGTLPYCSTDLRDAVLNIVPKIVKAVWYADIPFDLVPIGEERGDDEEIAEINQKVLEWDFRNLRVYLKYVDGMFQKAVFGTTIVKTPPHFEWITKNIAIWNEMKYAGQKSKPGKKVKRWQKDKERMFMGTDFVVTDLMDFWIDPVTTLHGVKDPVEYNDCIESIIIRQNDLLFGKDEGLYVNVDKIEDYYVGAKSGKDTAAKQRIKRAGHLTDDEKSNYTVSVKERGNKAYEIKEMYADFDVGDGPERCLIVIGADKECIRLQPWEGDKPYLSSRYMPNGYNREFYGTGIIESNLSNHYELNATRKQVLMARTMGLNMEMLSDQTGFRNKPDRLRTAPNKIHYVQNINGVKPFDKPIGQILQSAIAHETNVKEELRNSTGNTLAIQGQPTPQNSTASGIQMLTAAGNEKFSLPLQLDESGLLEPFVKRCLQNNVEYRKEAFVIRLTDKKPVKIYPEDLSPNFDVYSKGSSELQNKETRQAGLLKAWEISNGAAQLEATLYGQPLTKFFELKKDIYANLGLSQPEQYLVDPKEIQSPKAPVLPPEAEWVLFKRMADGLNPPMPILIQPGEDYRDHYEKHVAVMNTEEFALVPDQLKMIWFAHVKSYEQVLQTMREQNREEVKEKEVKSKEVAVSA